MSDPTAEDIAVLMVEDGIDYSDVNLAAYAIELGTWAAAERDADTSGQWMLDKVRECATERDHLSARLDEALGQVEYLFNLAEADRAEHRRTKERLTEALAERDNWKRLCQEAEALAVEMIQAERDALQALVNDIDLSLVHQDGSIVLVDDTLPARINAAATTDREKPT
jgi:hypothetical protein